MDLLSVGQAICACQMQNVIGVLEAKDLSKELFRDMWNVEGQVLPV